MHTSKILVAAFAFAAALGISAPAFAGPVTPVTVSDVGINWAQGEGVPLNTEGVWYAGPISMNVNGFPVLVFCNDLYNVIYIGSTDKYWQTDQAGANAYLSPLSISTDKQIAGLAFLGMQGAYANTLSPEQGAAFQVAIWELEYKGLTSLNGGLQTDVNALISNAQNDYNAFTAAGWTYSELESPCDPSLAGSITYTSAPYQGNPNCQVQGQILVAPGSTVTNVPVPEPITLSLFGAGVGGAVLMRRRQKRTP